MGIIDLNDGERTSVIKRIIKFFDEIEVYIFLSPEELEEDLKFMFTIGPRERILDLFKPLDDKKKLQAILDMYKTSDIFAIINWLATSKLSYDKIRKQVMNYGENKPESRIISAGFFPKFLPQAELSELANLILDKIVNPETYYALILLPSVDIPANIEINNVFSLIRTTSDITEDFITNDPSEKEEKFDLKEQKTYLLIKQEGMPTSFFGIKPHLLDHLESKLKVLLGLSLVQEIFDKLPDNGFESQEKQKDKEATKFIGIFEREQQYELEYGIDEFEEYESGKYKFRYLSNYSLRNEDAVLINSLTISRSATEPMHRLKVIKGGNIERLAKSEELKPPIECLKEQFNKKIRNVLDSDDEYAEAVITSGKAGGLVKP